MKRRVLVALVACGIVAGWMMEPALARKGKGGKNPAPVPVLTDVEAGDLQFMREEEKLARDVYLTMLGVYGSRVFDNISQSEQRHMDTMLGLLNKYGVVDLAQAEIGLFTDTYLQDLYNNLVADGLQSKLDALMVGALIEEVDIKDIDDAMERTDKADILAAYANLLAGSENHLNAFVRNIEAITGETYVAQLLPQADVDAILGR